MLTCVLFANFSIPRTPGCLLETLHPKQAVPSASPCLFFLSPRLGELCMGVHLEQHLGYMSSRNHVDVLRTSVGANKHPDTATVKQLCSHQDGEADIYFFAVLL